MQDIVELYKSYEPYKNYSNEEIRLHILPSLNLRQYKKHYENNELVGFTNWAYLSDNALSKFKKTADFNNDEWNSGVNLVFVDFVAKKNVRKIFKWCIEQASKFKGLKENFTWLRIENNKPKRIITRKR